MHTAVYDYLIYTTGAKEIKDALITTFASELTNTLKNALLTQARYLISNQTNIGLWNGVVRTPTGVDIKDIQDTLTKVIAPEVYNILLATRPNLLYAGGYNVRLKLY